MKCLNSYLPWNLTHIHVHFRMVVWFMTKYLQLMTSHQPRLYLMLISVLACESTELRWHRWYLLYTSMSFLSCCVHVNMLMSAFNSNTTVAMCSLTELLGWLKTCWVVLSKGRLLKRQIVIHKPHSWVWVMWICRKPHYIAFLAGITAVRKTMGFVLFWGVSRDQADIAVWCH